MSATVTRKYCHKLPLILRNWSNQVQFHFLLFWEVLVIISIIPTAFLVIFQVVYNASLVWPRALIYGGDAIYIVSIGIRFLQSYTTRRGEVIKDWKKTTRKYLRTYFTLDLISVIPFELLMIHGVLHDRDFSMAIFRLNRYIRIYRVWLFICKLSYKVLQRLMVYRIA